MKLDEINSLVQNQCRVEETPIHKTTAKLSRQDKVVESEIPEMRLAKRKSIYATPFPRSFKQSGSKRSKLTHIIPPLSFADSDEVWSMMCEVNDKYVRSENVFKNHPVLSPQMRAILLDWIMDVCEAYNLHRETLHLAVDYLDRYLLSQKNVLKNHLQLIGITCLFVAAKIEEIYPPKLSVFSYVTDGACTEAQILDMELVLMKTLKWRLSPITSTAYLNLYLQVLALSRQSTRSLESRNSKNNTDLRLLKPTYHGVDFVRAARMLDLAALDICSLKFPYALLASAAMYHVKGKAPALYASGFTWEQLAPCVNFMAPYNLVLKGSEVPDVLPVIGSIPEEERHLIQSQCVSLQMLEQAQMIASTSKLCSPIPFVEGLLTPPHSTEKPCGKL